MGSRSVRKIHARTDKIYKALGGHVKMSLRKKDSAMNTGRGVRKTVAQVVRIARKRGMFKKKEYF